MDRMRRGYLLVGLFVGLVIGANTSEAQFSGNNKTNLISGVTSNWVGTYYVGNGRSADALLIESAGVLSNGSGVLGNFSASNNCAVVSGPGSVWNNNGGLIVGNGGWHNSLVISNGGQVFNSHGVLGDNFMGSSSNSALVTGPGSLWKNSSDLEIGGYGSANTLVISNGGWVTTSYAYIGFNSFGNSVLVTGLGSVWSNSFSIQLYAAGNQLVIRDGGQVISGSSAVALGSGTMLVTDPGSIWSNGSYLDFSGFKGSSLVISNGGHVICADGELASASNRVRIVDSGVWQSDVLRIGDEQPSNTVVVAGGSLLSTNLVIGFPVTVCNNLLQLDSGTVLVTNATADAVLEVRYGKLIVNGGTLRADVLVLTNGCSQLVHTGGVILAGSVILNPNTFRIVSIARQGNDMLVTWMMGPGATNTLQATAGNGSGGYNTNGFTDIFVVTNNTLAGTVTNYLDVGGATNVPARYYRSRLAP